MKSYTAKDTKALKRKKMPSHLLEVCFISTNLFLMRFYNEQVYEALTFTTILLPLMIYFVLSLFGNLIRFVQLMHMEDIDPEDGIVSPK